MKKIINLDCDGTWIDLYGVENWLDDLIAEKVRPYLEAKPLVRLSALARVLNSLQKNNWEINIISWTSKNSSIEYHNAVKQAKLLWLKKHIPSVKWDNIFIVKYGTPKSSISNGILFDDELNNRKDWGENAFNEKNLIKNLYSLLHYEMVNCE